MSHNRRENLSIPPSRTSGSPHIIIIIIVQQILQVLNSFQFQRVRGLSVEDITKRDPQVTDTTDSTNIPNSTTLVV